MLKNKSSASWRLLAVAMIIFVTGCASAYHDNADCRIPYLYCTPPPLPYVPYDNCHCPTPGASQYFQHRGISNSSAVDSDIPIEAPTPPGQDEPSVPVPE